MRMWFSGCNKRVKHTQNAVLMQYVLHSMDSMSTSLNVVCDFFVYSDFENTLLWLKHNFSICLNVYLL